MLKYKAIASAPAFPTWIQSRVNEISKQAYDVAHANVQARLFNSQPVKKAMDGCMSDIRTSLGLGDAPTRRAKRTHKADYEQALDGNYVGLLPHVVKGSIPMSDGDTEAKTSSAIYRRLQDREQASSSDGNLDYGVYGSRLAASLEDSFEGFSEPEIPGAQELRAKSCNLPSKHVPRSPSIHSSVYTDRPGSLPLGNMQSPPKVNANVKATTFLPSLTMGGYWSGSEPASDDEDSLSGPRRKNRRGQRERRSIAEKKYKQNANHLRNQRKGHDMNLGWEARRGAQVDDGRGERGRVRGGKSGTLQAPSFVNGAASSSGPNSDPLRPRSAGKGKPAEGLIHPSWQAAKVAKEQNKAATFQGKRVVFD